MGKERREPVHDARPSDEHGSARRVERRADADADTVADAAADPAGIEADARLDRMDRVAVLYAEITAATRAFLAALAESDRHRDWAGAGFGSCAEWLAWRLGIARNTANEKVRAARALEHLPRISDAMGRGELSFSKVRALTRAATPDNEADLLEFARAASTAKLERLIRGLKTLDREDEARVEKARHLTRSFSVFPDDEGMYVVKGRLPAEVGAALMRAVEGASDALFTETGHDLSNPDERPEPAQLRADALGLVAERALAAGFGGAASADVSGSRAERYQVVLHVESATLAESGEPGQSELEDGTRVSAETARRLSCDCATVRVRHGVEDRTGDVGGAAAVAVADEVADEAADEVAAAANEPAAATGTAGAAPTGMASIGQPAPILDVGRRTRTVPSPLRRALEARDRGCRFPGCGLRFTDAHHIHHWADGGTTSLDNLVLLCRRHHRRVHEGGYRVHSDRNGSVVFFTPGGDAMFDAPELPRLARDPARAMIRRNRGRGVRPRPHDASPRFRRDRDIPWRLEARAREAIDGDALDDDELDDGAIDDGGAIDGEVINDDAEPGGELHR